MIWLGDLARAYQALAPATSAERTEIARLLGYGERRIRVAAAGVHRPSWPVPDYAAPAAQPEEPDDQALTAGPGPSAALSAGDTSERWQAPVTPDDLPRQRPASVVAYHPETVLTGGAGFGAARVTRLEHVPLLPPDSARAVLQTLLAQYGTDGPVDVAQLVRAAATCRMTGLVRQTTKTMRHGVQILVDEAVGMAPFVEDQDHVVGQVRQLVGINATAVRYFSDSPLRGTGSGPIWTWEVPYRPPMPGTTVLLLSDFGIGGRWIDPARGHRQEWERFAALTAGRGCPVVALVPYPRRRRPRWLDRLFTVVIWDRTLTASQAAAACR